MKKKSHDKLGGNLQDPHMRNRKPLKVRTLKDNLDFVPEPPGQDEKERDQEYSGDNWDAKVKASGPNPNSLLDGEKEITVDGGFTEVTVTATELDILYAKINAVDRKLDYLLDILKSKK